MPRERDTQGFNKSKDCLDDAIGRSAIAHGVVHICSFHSHTEARCALQVEAAWCLSRTLAV